MIPVMDAAEFYDSRHIKNLLPRIGPCLSIYLPLHMDGETHSTLGRRLRNALQQAQSMLTSLPGGAAILPSPDLWQYAKHAEAAGQTGSLAIFDTPGYTAIVRLAGQATSSVHAGEDFYIRPLLESLQRERTFYLLALSEKHVRLLRCTGASMEDVPLPDQLPHSVWEAGQFSVPDHMLENRAAAGKAAGAKRRIHFSTSAEEEKQDAHLSTLFSAVARSVEPLMRKMRSSLMLAGVTRNTCLYRKMCASAALLAEEVDGSPEGFTQEDLHQKALHAWRTHLAAEQEAAWQEVLAAKEADHAIEDPLQLLYAAEHGRIHRLILSSQESGDASDEMLNHLALETLRHGGDVQVMTDPSAPVKFAVAIVRYANHWSVDGFALDQSIR